MPGIERIPGGTPMRAAIAKFIMISAVLIPALLAGSGSAAVDTPEAKTGGYREVTFHVA